MTDLVALIVGVAYYPDLPGWNVADDRSARDAIAIATALRQRGVPKEKIKLLVSAARDVGPDVEGVRVEPAQREHVEKFITRELGQPPFDGTRFLLFWSGHGVEAGGRPEPLVITADSFKTANARRVFYRLGIDSFRAQLQGMPFFRQQLFCVNACRTPEEWSITANDEDHSIHTLRYPRSDLVRQTRFYAAEELKPVPVKTGPDGLSNAFAACIRDCIAESEWPPQETDWLQRLKAAWGPLWWAGVSEVNATAFKRLRDQLRTIDRRGQRGLVDKAFRTVLERQRSGTATGTIVSTVIDLHACTADRLDILITRLEEDVFRDRFVPEGIQRVKRWPAVTPHLKGARKSFLRN
jgi:hypothetical protein